MYFVYSNNVSLFQKECITKNDGVVYGDSYSMDPHGEIVMHSPRHVEDFLFADIDPTITDRSWNLGRSMQSAREFSQQLKKLANPPRWCSASGKCEPPAFEFGVRDRSVHALRSLPASDR